jgi:hypothetical protein
MAMSEAVQELLNSFDRLPEPDRWEAFCQIMRRSQELEYPPLDDETLAQIADETFLMYDAEETADGQS